LTQLTPRRLSAAALLAVTGAVALTLLVFSPAKGQNNVNLNNQDCQGRIEPGIKNDLDEKGVTQVKYQIACQAPITGYSIQLPKGIEGFDTDAIVYSKAFQGQGVGVPSDSFTCNGDIPGLGFNCVGVYSGQYNNIVGQFSIKGKLRKRPLINPRLTVVTATVASGKAVTSISGPFELGTPRKNVTKP